MLSVYTNKIEESTTTKSSNKTLLVYMRGQRFTPPSISNSQTPVTNSPTTPIGTKDDLKEQPPDVSNHKNLQLLPCEDCGYLENQDRIRNGQKASLNEFPWMALLSYNTERGPAFKCGGTIINEHYILTAAHCISNLKDQLLDVRVGEQNIMNETDCETDLAGTTKCNGPVQDLTIEKIIAHPGYNTTVICNDIGLLRVSKINLNGESARPVCLPLDSARDQKFNYAIVTGWGYTGEDAGSSDHLLKVELPMVNLEKCQNAYKGQQRVAITTKQLCAGGKDNKDSCPGDSGGPLQSASFVFDDVRYVQYGIVSFGPKYCGLDGYPGVYTRVSYYMDWILDTIEP